MNRRGKVRPGQYAGLVLALAVCGSAIVLPILFWSEGKVLPALFFLVANGQLGAIALYIQLKVIRDARTVHPGEEGVASTGRDVARREVPTEPDWQVPLLVLAGAVAVLPGFAATWLRFRGAASVPTIPILEGTMLYGGILAGLGAAVKSRRGWTDFGGRLAALGFAVAMTSLGALLFVGLAAGAFH